MRRSSSVTLSVKNGSSAPPNLRRLFARRALSADTRPSERVSNVTTRSASPYSTRRSTSASVEWTVGCAVVLTP